VAEGFGNSVTRDLTSVKRELTSVKRDLKRGSETVTTSSNLLGLAVSLLVVVPRPVRVCV
jgi:hypothetical protein